MGSVTVLTKPCLGAWESGRGALSSGAWAQTLPAERT
jgi:hypothetical protein